MGITKKILLEKAEQKFVYHCPMCGDSVGCDHQSFNHYLHDLGHCDWCEHIMQKIKDPNE